MQRKPVHKTVHPFRSIFKTGLQHFFCPIGISGVRTTTHLENRLLWIIISHIGLISAVQIAVIGRGHIAAASPVLIADAEVIHLPGFFSAVLAAQVCHGGYPIKSHILYPLGHLLNSTASHIAIDISLTADLLTQFEELMGTEAVIFRHTAPVGVDHLLAVLLRADTVLPVVFICEASTGPAQHRKLHLLQGCHHIVTHAFGIGDLGILSYIQSLINTSSQMLREIAVKFRIDMSLFLLFVNINLCHIDPFCGRHPFPTTVAASRRSVAVQFLHSVHYWKPFTSCQLSAGSVLSSTCTFSYTTLLNLSSEKLSTLARIRRSCSVKSESRY